MTEREILCPDLVAGLITEQAARAPMQTGLIFEGRAYTYAEMNDRTNQAAAALQALGVRRGDRIAWIARNLAIFWDALFGAAKIGAVMTPINWRLAPAEIAQILADSEAAVLVGEKDFITPLEDAGAKLPAKTLMLETGAGSFDALVNTQDAVEAKCAAHIDDAFIQLYTSGTTGLPKGVVLSHRAYQANNEINANERVLAPKFDNEVAIHALPHFHVAGVNFGMMAIARAMPIVQLRQFDPVAIVKAAQDAEAVNSFFVPAMIMMILEAAKAAEVSLENFSNVSYGAAPMPEPLLNAAMQAMPHATFTQFYGSTENCGAVTRLVHDDHAAGLKQRASAGKPWFNTEVKICDPESGAALGEGATGEIWMRSGAVMDGYWKREDATGEAIVDGWYRTGDAGYLDEDGYLYVCDRVKDMIISGGENIYPAEIENVLAQHPAVLEAAIIGAPDEKWGEVVKAFVVKRAGTDLSADDITTHLADRVAKFKMPREIAFIGALPRNPSGKILKTELRKL